MQHFLQLRNRAKQRCYIVHFVLQICKMCPHTIFKWGFVYLNFILASLRNSIFQNLIISLKTALFFQDFPLLPFFPYHKHAAFSWG